MLVSLSVTNFAITEHLEVDFCQGMTAITGETGAGKSISIDALGLALGNRGDSKLIKHGADKTDICAVFDIKALANVQLFLQEHELAGDGDCILRRIITKDGRSKAYINGTPVNLQQLKTLGAMLVDIHSQHAHHQLMQKDSHQHLLDAFGGHDKLQQKTENAYKQWHSTQKAINALEQQTQEADTKREYLAFQLQEFDELAIAENEFIELEQQHAHLANSEAIEQTRLQSLQQLKEADTNACDIIAHAMQGLEAFIQQDEDLRAAHELLEQSQITLDEACIMLRDYHSQHSDAQGLAQLEQRLTQLHDLARKHRVPPEQLLEVQQNLQTELNNLDTSSEQLQTLQQQLGLQQQLYIKHAKALSSQRQKTAKKLSAAIIEQLQLLGMHNCQFSIALHSDEQKFKAQGFDAAEFLVSTNPGQPAQALQKVASGGELSRISLAIQVITAQTATVPTLIFDEVDVGIGGATAEVVGRLLKNLGQSAQIINVTHQAQVAACADQHYLVHKTTDKKRTQTTMAALEQEQKINELARMLGGVEITELTREHAKEMLNAANA